ncbi:MAG: YdcF family protein [Cyanobacteria bacterium Co-bin13]|nr:YdcF family protein [Cyanobacteria bacterium Co-bin13]
MIFRWVTQPALVLPVLIGFTALPWLLRAERWKRPITRIGVTLTLIYLVMFSPTIAKIGNRFLMVGVPQDPGQPADAIVVLGRGAPLRSSRVDVAAALWRQQRAPLIFSSGRGDALEIAQRLQSKGVPAQALDGEPCSSTTEENAEFTAALLQPQGVRRIVLVTDPPHMLRSQLTFQSFGFDVTPHISPLPGNIKNRGNQVLVLREWAGLIAYGLMGRYFARSASPEVPWANQTVAPTALNPSQSPLQAISAVADRDQV